MPKLSLTCTRKKCSWTSKQQTTKHEIEKMVRPAHQDLPMIEDPLDDGALTVKRVFSIGHYGLEG